jgi:three-Cys-motif partner protein
MAVSENYSGREQSWVKHWMLQRYLERLILKVGRNWDRFMYIDGFAGPWGAKANDLSDTSFGCALDVMRACQDKLAQQGRQVAMHAICFEKERKAAERLKEFARATSTSRLTIEAHHKDFMDHIGEVAGQLSDSDFAFALIDPTGYRDMVPARLAPLLKRRSVEVLINLMWDFINRAWDNDDVPVLDEIFGEDRRAKLRGAAREVGVAKLFAERLRAASGGLGGRLYAATFPVQNPTKERTHYFLVYATHSPHGLVTFGDVAEDTWPQQALAMAQAKVHRQSGGLDLFNGEVLGARFDRPIDKAFIREAWLKLMPVAGSEIRVTYAVMAGLLESCACLPIDLQAVARELIEGGFIQAMDVDDKTLKRRTRNTVHLAKSERLRRIR